VFWREGLQRYELETGTITRLPGPEHAGDWEALRYTPDARELVLVDRTGGSTLVVVWDVQKQTVVSSWGLPRDHFADWALSPDTEQFAVGSTNTLVMHSTRNGSVLHTFPVSSKSSGVEFSPDGTWLVAARYADRSEPTRIYEIRSGKVLHELADFHANSMAFSPDRNLLAGIAIGTSGKVWLMDLSGRQTFLLPVSSKQDYWFATFAPAGRVLVAGGNDSVLSLWDLDHGNERIDVQWGDGDLGHAEWSPDGRWLATWDGFRARLWPWPGLLEAARAATNSAREGESN
jgi:WD40 repeat protein